MRNRIHTVASAIFVGVALMAAGTMGCADAADASSMTEATLAAAAEMTAIRGELVRMEGEYFIIRDSKGKEVRVQVDQHTKMQDAVQVGDTIEAEVSGQNHAETIRKASR